MIEIDWSKRKLWTAEQIAAERSRLTALESPWERHISTQRWAREKLVAVAYGIELCGVVLMLEADWERTSAAVDRRVGCCVPWLDEFFALWFSPMVTSWVRDFPDEAWAQSAFDRYKALMADRFDFAAPAYAHRLLTRR